MTREGNFSFRSKVAATTTAVVLAIVLGCLDYFTGREWAISAFYLVPISLVAWIAGKTMGIDRGSIMYLLVILQ